jgi:nuclear receptor interaction protein
MDKGAAARFWGLKVGRSLLMRAAEGVTFDYVNRAFGGLGLRILSTPEGRAYFQGDMDTEEEERLAETLDLVAAMGEDAAEDARPSESSLETRHTTRDTPEGSASSDVEMPTLPTVHIELAEGVEEESDDEGSNENEESDSGSSDFDDDEDDDDEYATERRLFRRRAIFARSRGRSSVNADVPYSSHTKVYKGHCNSRTVKDVNYYGLNDEYVVSGSDDGNFFIWDRKTTKILNILEGDGEVVNVVQGHPYEPMIACSGIDSTVKIFGPGGDNRERTKAAQGIDVANPAGSAHSSLRFGIRRRARQLQRVDHDVDDDDGDEAGERTMAGGLTSRRAMHRSYEITSQNDVERRRDAGDTFVTVGSMEELLARAWIMSSLHVI